MTDFYKRKHLRPFDLNGILVYETVVCGKINMYPATREGGKMAVENFNIVKGNDRTVRVFVKTHDLDIIDLTGAVGVLSLRTEREESPVVELITTDSEQGRIGAADEGELIFYLSSGVTATLEGRQYLYDVTVTLDNGKKYTVLAGWIEVQVV